jgi:hypothetical protein
MTSRSSSRRYLAITAAVHGQPAPALPSVVALMEACLLLHCIDDPLIQKLGLTTAKALRHLKGQLVARNQSVLAHGTMAIDDKLSNELAKLALRSVRAFWELEFDDQNVDERISTLEFVVDA